MKPKTMVLMMVAIGCGLAASYMTSRVIADRTADQGEVEMTTILVAKKNLNLGTLLKDPEACFEEKSFTKGEEPKKAIREFAMLKDKRLNKGVTAEMFVTQDDLWDKEHDSLAGQIPAGMRGFGIRTNVEQSSGGFVLPHSHVDLVSVIHGPNGETKSKIIMQNVLVLAVDQDSNRSNEKNSMVPTTVTVQVTPAQAEQIALAQDMGQIRLILRSFGDDTVVHTGGAIPSGLGRGSEANKSESDEEDSGSEQEAEDLRQDSGRPRPENRSGCRA